MLRQFRMKTNRNPCSDLLDNGYKFENIYHAHWTKKKTIITDHWIKRGLYFYLVLPDPCGLRVRPSSLKWCQLCIPGGWRSWWRMSRRASPAPRWRRQGSRVYSGASYPCCTRTFHSYQAPMRARVNSLPGLWLFPPTVSKSDVWLFCPLLSLRPPPFFSFLFDIPDSSIFGTSQ